MCWNMLNPHNIVYAECQGRIELPGAGVLFKDLMGLPYGCSGPSSSLQTSLKLITDPQPHTRQQALQILTALGQQHHGSSAASSTVDAIFQRLCVVAATDSIAKMRLQALQALAGRLMLQPAICPNSTQLIKAAAGCCPRLKCHVWLT